MKIYKISVKNKNLVDKAPPVYFQEKRTAEAVVATFDLLTAKGKKIEWECEVIEVMSHQDAYEHLEALGNEILD